jgi:hypothetical protein
VRISTRKVGVSIRASTVDGNESGSTAINFAPLAEKAATGTTARREPPGSRSQREIDSAYRGAAPKSTGSPKRPGRSPELRDEPPGLRFLPVWGISPASDGRWRLQAGCC